MSHFAFRLFEQRQRPRIVISRLDGWPAGFPCQRFASHLAMRVRMARGQGDSPFLPRIGLPPTTTCQFVLAPSNHLFPHARPYRRPDNRTIARCLLKTHPRAWFLQALRRPESPHAWALRPLGASAGRSGERGGALAGKPRCVRILTITAGSSMAAMILNSPPHCGQGCGGFLVPTRYGAQAQHLLACARPQCDAISARSRLQ